MPSIVTRGAFPAFMLAAMLTPLSVPAHSAKISGCELKYPIVLSHHWGARKICVLPKESAEDGRTYEECKLAGGDEAQCLALVTTEDCEAREPAKYCTGWEDDLVNGGQNCTGGWRVPDDELDLPPRSYNLFDNTIVRDTSAYHRYYGPDMVERLEACGNDVYLSDKPAFTTYAIRARALRNTVKQALQETGKSKVILMGLSQGSQDARYMTAVLPFDDNDPTQGMMTSRVAAVVSTSGEPHGAESASLSLDLTYMGNAYAGETWGDSDSDPYVNALGIDALNLLYWRDTQIADENANYVLIENPQQGEVGLSQQQRYNHFLGSFTVLSRRYMRGYSSLDWSWDDLIQYLNDNSIDVEDKWIDVVRPELEQNNGVQYYSYAAKIQNWADDDWGPTEKVMHDLISFLYGPNEAYVTVEGQRFDTVGYPNFHHIRTLDGSIFGRGYHHMFFTGRNPIYGPGAAWLQESGYKGTTADFYEQVARDLIVRGF